jgi:chromosomal replication initiator protein
MLRLEDRLKTRFEWGLLADIQPPDYETRMAIIKNKAIRMGVELPEEVLIYVAENITANVRQIEGTVNKILAFRDLLGNNVDASSVTRAVRDMFKDTTDILPTADVIIEEVCKFYNVEDPDLRGQSRNKELTQARQIAMYLIRNMTKLSLKDIGKEFQNRDHTTVLHSIDRIEKLSKKDPEIAEVVKDIRSNVNNRYG